MGGGKGRSKKEKIGFAWFLRGTQRHNLTRDTMVAVTTRSLGSNVACSHAQLHNNIASRITLWLSPFAHSGVLAVGAPDRVQHAAGTYNNTTQTSCHTPQRGAAHVHHCIYAHDRIRPSPPLPALPVWVVAVGGRKEIWAQQILQWSAQAQVVNCRPSIMVRSRHV